MFEPEKDKHPLRFQVLDFSSKFARDRKINDSIEKGVNAENKLNAGKKPDWLFYTYV